MTSFITRCPHCNTFFNTSVSQLESAGGMVRCGSCLTVFEADGNLIPTETSEAEVVEEPTPAPAAQTPQTDDDISAAGLLWELVGTRDATATDDSTATDDAAVPDNAVASSKNPHEDKPTEKEQHDKKEIHEQIAAIHPEPDAESAQSLSPENLAAINAVSDPLELSAGRPKSRAGRIAAMLTLCLTLILTLALQIIWQNFESLSQDSRWRPWLERACDPLNCTLPPQTNLAAIRSDNLDIRSHPTIEGALTVSVIFSNQADFSQPFPALDLRFSDRNDRPVAARRFTPEEYLPDGLQPMAMPVRSPVQIELALADPGEDAVNYQLSFSPAGR